MFKIPRQKSTSHPLQSDNATLSLKHTDFTLERYTLPTLSITIAIHQIIPAIQIESLAINYEEITRKINEENARFRQVMLETIYNSQSPAERYMADNSFFRSIISSVENLQRQHSEFHAWWNNTETQRRYRTVCERELSLREEDLNPARLSRYGDINIPEEFLCPISYAIMTTPVYNRQTPTGPRCEILVLLTWIDQHGTCPFTRLPMTREDIECDEALKVRLDQFVENPLSSSLNR